MPSARYQLFHGQLQASAASADLLARLDSLVGELVLPDDAPAAPDGRRFDLELTEAPLRPIPADATIIASGDDPLYGRFSSVAFGGASLFELADRMQLIVHADQRRAELIVAPGESRWAALLGGIAALDEAAVTTGQTIIHTAGLSLPGGASDDPNAPIVLLHAPSGTGKTTSCLALVRAGFGLASDDGMVVRVGADGASGWGLPRDLKVHRNTLAMMPWIPLDPAGVWDVNGEQPLTRARLSAVGRIEPPAPRPIAALIHLVRAGAARSTCRPLARADAAMALMADNIRIGRAGLPRTHAFRFTCLADLVAKVPTFQVDVGPDPSDLAQTILAGLAAAGVAQPT